MTALLRAYALATRLAIPFIARRRIARLRGAGVPAYRAHEVVGVTAGERPGGALLWVHAASVGESLSVLPLIRALQARAPGLKVMVTSVTPTSAQMLEDRLPQGAWHQFAPLDAPGPVDRFLKRWRPDAALFVESEIWPNMLLRSDMPRALVGARLSERSLRRWASAPRTASALLGRFNLILAQNDAVTQALRSLGPAPVETGGNLKALSGALPIDTALLEGARAALAGRPAWIAASTHPGEEEVILAAHKTLRQQHADLCLILVPRHPERRAEVEALAKASDLPLTTRSTGGMPDKAVWVVDTLGELGSLYPLAPLVLLGGSLREIGGHNPFEVAHAGAAILTGPHTGNFSETYAALEAAGAVTRVDDSTLAAAVGALLDAPEDLARLRKAATGFAAAQTGEADALAAQLAAVLGLEEAP
ncbi:MAG: 3-deoxy-D-manno-octulosonic acid transferase [Pseudomonadota bacterium]